MRIAISGKCRSGKDTVADIIINSSQLTWTRLSFASTLYKCVSNIQKAVGVPVEKDGSLLQIIGEKIRNHYGEDVWANIIEKYIMDHPEENIIVTDVRYSNELKMLSKRGFSILRVNRKQRFVDRDPTHISEIDLDYAHFDSILNNDFDLDHLKRCVVDIVEKVLPKPL